MGVFIAALFTTDRKWKPPKVLPTEQRVRTMRLHSVTERSEVLIHATMWMNLENIMPYRSPSLWKILEKTRGKSGLQDSKCSSKAAVVKAVDIDRRTDKRMKQEKAKKQILIHGHYLWRKRHYRAWEKDGLFKNSAWFRVDICSSLCCHPRDPGLVNTHMKKS